MKAIFSLVKEAVAEMKANIKQIQKTANDAFQLAQHQQTRTDVIEKESRLLRDEAEDQENCNCSWRNFKEEGKGGRTGEIQA